MQRITLLLLAGAVLTGSVLSASSTQKASSTAQAFVSSTTRTYKYFDDSSSCSGYSSTTFLSSYGADAYLKAWNPSKYSKTPVGGCTMKFASDGSYGMKYSFDFGDYITDCSVTLKIYESSNDYGFADKTYSCYDTLPTYTTTTTSGYLTVKLLNSYPYSTNFNFNLHIQNYDYSDYTTSYPHIYSYLDAGKVTGIVIGTVVFIVLLVVVSIFVRRRRYIYTRTVVARGLPVATTTTTYPVGTHVPPPAGVNSISTTTTKYP